MNSAAPSFFARLALAFRSLFRVLFDAGFALSVAELFRKAGLASSTGGAGSDPAARSSEPPAVGLSAAVGRGLAPEAPAPPALPPAEQGALALLRVLQREGRLIDFLEQEVTPFSDAEVGAVARIVHEGCRKALHHQLTVRPICASAEGEPLTIQSEGELLIGKWKLTGNVGVPPYNGTLRHKGWLALDLHLPLLLGSEDPHVLCPAELELT